MRLTTYKPSLGERAAWARNQQNLTIALVSSRSGLSADYISRLELGVESNPALRSLEKLSKALAVPIGFLVGEVNTLPDFLAASKRNQTAFMNYLWSQPEVHIARFEHSSVSRRVEFILEFLCDAFPDEYTVTSLVCQLGLSVSRPCDMPTWDGSPADEVLRRIEFITGIPADIIRTGDVRDGLEVHARLQGIVREATTKGLTPEQLEEAIRRYDHND